MQYPYTLENPSLTIRCLAQVYKLHLDRKFIDDRAVGAGQAIVLFSRFLGKGGQKCSCAGAMDVYSSSWCNSWTVIYSSPHLLQ